LGVDTFKPNSAHHSVELDGTPADEGECRVSGVIWWKCIKDGGPENGRDESSALFDGKVPATASG
jgi:hypothetical protein